MAKIDDLLVVGGDSLVGTGVVAALEATRLAYYSTTRRGDSIGGNRVFLDFRKGDLFRVPDGVGTALVIAAATDYDRCETDPIARVINVELVPRTIENLLNQGLHVIFVSTNSVFGGERPWPAEDDLHEPGIAYAQQKSEAEAALCARAKEIGAIDRLGIVRLTKVMNASVSPLPSWFQSWEQGESVTPFADLIFAPISVKYVANALITLANKRASGNLHLSGAENVDYVRFATLLAERLRLDVSLIGATTATDQGVRIAFKPTYSGLGMTRTTHLTGLMPQPLVQLVDDLVEDYRK